jgi:hypothetical protein
MKSEMSNNSAKNDSNAQQSSSSSPSGSKFGLYTTLGIGVLAIGGSIAAIPFLTPAMRKHALPYIPATPKQIDNVFKSIRIYGTQNSIPNTQVTKNNLVKLVDLGISSLNFTNYVNE